MIQNFLDLKEDVLANISNIRTNLNQVKPFLEYIELVSGSLFWENISFTSLEEMRIKLRDLMKYRVKREPVKKLTIDISDPLFEGTIREDDLSHADMDAYKKESWKQLSISQMQV